MGPYRAIFIFNRECDSSFEIIPVSNAHILLPVIFIEIRREF